MNKSTDATNANKTRLRKQTKTDREAKKSGFLSKCRQIILIYTFLIFIPYFSKSDQTADSASHFAVA